MKTNAALLLILVFLINVADAHAYIDPGTGGVVFSYISYLIAAAVTILGLLLLPFKRIGLRILRRIQSKKKEKSRS
jgi:hypothetical protein